MGSDCVAGMGANIIVPHTQIQSEEETPPVEKKPNPRNVENEKKLVELEATLAGYVFFFSLFFLLSAFPRFLCLR